MLTRSLSALTTSDPACLLIGPVRAFSDSIATGILKFLSYWILKIELFLD